MPTPPLRALPPGQRAHLLLLAALASGCSPDGTTSRTPHPWGDVDLSAAAAVDPQTAHPADTDPTLPDTDVPSPAWSARRPPMVHVDAQNACALDEDGEAFCWGDTAWVFRDMDGGPYDILCNKSVSAMAVRRGAFGVFAAVPDQYNTGGRNMAAEPYAWDDFDCGVTPGIGACGVDVDGIVRCYNVGAGDIPETTGWVKVSIGYRSVCAVHATEGVTCWGSAERLGAFAYAIPPAVDVDAGTGGACVITRDRRVVCAGSASGIVDRVPPNLDRVRSVAVGNAWACALRISGDIVCWGESLGVPNSEVVDEVPTTDDFVALDVNWGHACASRADGSVACWGIEDSGVTEPPAP